MEPKHKELLAQCRPALAQAMSEVDAVVELLQAAGALGPRDLLELEEAGAGAAPGKAELLLKLLLAKERDHFQDLRVALEKTQPHLLSILYLNGAAGAPAGEAAGEWRWAWRSPQPRRVGARGGKQPGCPALPCPLPRREGLGVLGGCQGGCSRGPPACMEQTTPALEAAVQVSPCRLIFFTPFLFSLFPFTYPPPPCCQHLGFASV